MNTMRTIALVAVTVALSVTIAPGSDLESETYGFAMDGTQVVPPTPQNMVGAGIFYLDVANELSYEMYECFLFGDRSEVEVHIHGPAAGGENAPIIFTIMPPAQPEFWWTGVIGTLNAQQLHDLNCGLWYVDIHTALFPDGEVRGQIRGMWGWDRPDPCFLPTHQSTWGAIKSLYRR